MDENCMNCKYCTKNDNGGYCEQDFYKEIVANYELEATWCTNWELKKTNIGD